MVQNAGGGIAVMAFVADIVFKADDNAVQFAFPGTSIKQRSPSQGFTRKNFNKSVQVFVLVNSGEKIFNSLDTGNAAAC